MYIFCLSADIYIARAAINLHYMILSPKYRMAREVAQSMLSEYLEPSQLKEISYKEIVDYIKRGDACHSARS